MDAYTKILFLVHIGGAIAGIGPTFGFAVMGKMIEKTPPPGNLAILETLMAIETKVVTPVALITQPLSGALLIFDRGLDTLFFQQEWLYVSIIAYIAVLVISYGIDNPAIHRVVKLAKEGKAGTPEFEANKKTTQRLGPILGILTVLIIFMMVWQPGR
ncbi:MAG TPA: DUF2269 family protein [Actinomycetota bacterium]